MPPITPDLEMRRELLWDKAGWTRRASAYCTRGEQTPTALAAAVFQILPPAAGAWLVGLDFSTDTNIQVNIGWGPSQGVAAAMQGNLLGQWGTAGPVIGTMGLVAAPAASSIFAEHFVGAYSSIDLLKGKWLWGDNTNYILLITGLVAANVKATFWMLDGTL